VIVRAGLLTLGLVAAAGAIAALALALGLGGAQPLDVSLEAIARDARQAPDPGSGDPLTFTEGSSARLAQRASLGTSHVVYAKSPDGVEASAERTAEWRAEVERAAGAHGVSPDVLEAMVFLESAGRPTVMADGTPNSASGLAQIIPATATDLLGMRVDLARSVELTKQIGSALERGDDGRARELVRERARIDERFDPAAALDGAGRYLEIARERFGSEQLAVVSYHMGIGNLESVIEAYTGRQTGDGDATAALIDDAGLDYPQLFFDSSPQRNAEAWRLLAGFGDDSSLYLWRVLASQEIMRKWRDDPEALDETASLATAKATLEEVYHPESDTEVFETHEDVEGARDDDELLAVPDDRSLGFKLAPQAGELAADVGAEPELYRALRPEALAALTYIGAKVQAISGAKQPLVVTSMTRDREYQDLLTGVNPEATTEYSLHTTGFSFDIRRDYASDRQAAAFQFVLDRLKAHALLDYAYEPAAIHVTVSDYARELVE
jgi:hypothetical protein